MIDSHHWKLFCIFNQCLLDCYVSDVTINLYDVELGWIKLSFLWLCVFIVLWNEVNAQTSMHCLYQIPGFRMSHMIKRFNNQRFSCLKCFMVIPKPGYHFSHGNSSRFVMARARIHHGKYRDWVVSLNMAGPTREAILDPNPYPWSGCTPASTECDRVLSFLRGSLCLRCVGMQYYLTLLYKC